MAGVVAAFVAAWQNFRTIPMLVLGQPKTVGLLQREQEAPFFRHLAETTDLPLVITYRTADSFGLKDTHQLEALRDGRVDIASLRFMQNITKEPALEGLDLPGMIPDFQQARRVAEAYAPTLDRDLQDRFGAKLLGLWSFGPQIMVCRSPLAKLSDLQGRKVRIASPGLAQLIAEIGGIPVILPFEDTKKALELGLVDCAVTSAASANFAGWTDHTRFYFPLAFQFGFNGYVISLAKWKALGPEEQERLSKAFSAFSVKLWGYSEELQRESERCILGGPCRQLRPSALQRVPVSREDVQLLQRISREVVLPSWSARCESHRPGCRRTWDQIVAPVTGFARPTQSLP
jgi:TRAP-type C4-dicarboxylate transport system substrate-binding protein